jgi:hypothetical protein
MRPDLEREILDRVAAVIVANKSWAAPPAWRLAPNHRSNHCLEIVAPLLLQGVVRSGFQARLNARADLPEREVYGQLELWCPEIERFLHFERVEWRPMKPHTNPMHSPAGLRGIKLTNRHHSFQLNRRAGLPGLLQTTQLTGVDLPGSIQTFNDFAAFVGEAWRIDMTQMPVPPWQGGLL